MSEFIEMKPLTALGGATPRSDSHGGVTLQEVSNLALASFASRHGQEDAARTCLEGFVGGTLPEPGHMAEASFATLWMGPDQWMVLAPHESHEDLAAQLVEAAKGSASITEQNDAWCCFDLTGPRLADVFELLCPVNLRAAEPGAATRTSIDHLGCFVMVLAPEHVRVLGPRSSAGSLHHALLTAMRSAL